jgi:hypothetical protein
MENLGECIIVIDIVLVECDKLMAISIDERIND